MTRYYIDQHEDQKYRGSSQCSFVFGCLDEGECFSSGSCLGLVVHCLAPLASSWEAPVVDS